MVRLCRILKALNSVLNKFTNFMQCSNSTSSLPPVVGFFHVFWRLEVWFWISTAFPPSLMKPICINLLHTKMLVDLVAVFQEKLQQQGNHPRVHGRLPHVESHPPPSENTRNSTKTPCRCGLFSTLLVQHHSHINNQFMCFKVSYPLLLQNNVPSIRSGADSTCATDTVRIKILS